MSIPRFLVSASVFGRVKSVWGAFLGAAVTVCAANVIAMFAVGALPIAFASRGTLALQLTAVTATLMILTASRIHYPALQEQRTAIRQPEPDVY